MTDNVEHQKPTNDNTVKNEKKQRTKADKITEDIVGADEWRQSKIGYITGVSSIGKVIGSSIQAVGQSMGRLAITLRILAADDSHVPSLPPVDEQHYDGRKRFQEAKVLHGRTDIQIQRAISNTRNSFYTYSALFFAAIAYLIYGLATNPDMSIWTFGLHITPMPVTALFAFKGAYYNWMFRNRRLEKPMVFIRSKEWLPKNYS